MLCPDGVEAGHTLGDMGGCDLSTSYDTPDDRMESGVAAWKKQLEALGDDLTMWIDIKTRRGGKGLTMWGCLPLLEASSSNKESGSQPADGGSIVTAPPCSSGEESSYFEASLFPPLFSNTVRIW